MFDDRIEIISPGKLLPPITLETLQNGNAVSRLRNTAIVEVFDRLGGYIEKIGTGVRRMIDGMKEHGLKPPQFELDYDVLKVTLRGPGEHFMELTEEVIPEDKLKELNERQSKAIQYIREKGMITNREYQKLCATSWDTAYRDLSELVQKDILRREGKGRSTHYLMII
jgi:ATP-dependent DNA helicase RecG